MSRIEASKPKPTPAPKPVAAYIHPEDDDESLFDELDHEDTEASTPSMTEDDLVERERASSLGKSTSAKNAGWGLFLMTSMVSKCLLRMLNMKPVTIDVLPVEASKSGRNAFYHSCPLLNRRASYAVCLHTIDAAKDGRLPESCECGPHIGRKLCDALKMREQEEAAGRSCSFKVFPSVTEERAIKKLNPDANIEILGPTRPDDRSYMRGWGDGWRLEACDFCQEVCRQGA